MIGDEGGLLSSTPLSAVHPLIGSQYGQANYHSADEVGRGRTGLRPYPSDL